MKLFKNFKKDKVKLPPIEKSFPDSPQPPPPIAKSRFWPSSWSNHALSKLIVNFLIVGGLLTVITWSQADRLNIFSNQDQLQDRSPTFQPLDALSSSVTAYSLASLVGFRETTWLESQAHNSRISNISGSGFPIVAKPAVINSTTRTKQDIAQYVVSAGDTVISLADDFGVSPDSIRWSNDLKGNSLTVGKTILIPPPGLNGIVHQVKSSDTYRSLSQKYSFSKNSLVNFNDLTDLDSLPIGEFIFIPNARLVGSRGTPSFIAKQIETDNPSAYVKVKAGDVLGRMGNTGWSTGPHLHLEIYSGRQRYNPWAFINQHRLTWPVDQKIRRVTQVYHSGHRGLDIGDASYGRRPVNILAVADGQIIKRGCFWPTSRRWSTFGVLIDHGNYHSLYIHLQAPNNPKYTACSINRRTSYGAKSIDYSITE